MYAYHRSYKSPMLFCLHAVYLGISINNTTMKAIIQRALPLDVKYTVTDRKYIPVLEGCGCSCDNCGKLIANIATVKSINGTYNIGFDCMETFLLNNSLLDGFDVSQHERVKSMIPKAIRLGKQIKEAKENSPSANITGILFEKPTFGDWITFFYLTNGQTSSRNNDSIKIKEHDFDFIVATIGNIFPQMQILVK